MAIFQALKPGSHIIAPDDMYWGFKKQLQTIFGDILTFDFIDLTDLIEEVEKYVKADQLL
jgi:cystathionine gamma-synthase